MIEQDLVKAEYFRTKVRGEGHSLMLQIYLEECEYFLEMREFSKANHYYSLARTTLNNQEEGRPFAKESAQLRRIEKILKNSDIS